MAGMNLRDDKALGAALATIQKQTADPKHWVHSWRKDIVQFLGRWSAASDEERASRAFQKRLWDDNPITSTGMGTVKIDAVLDDAEFRAWVVGLSRETLPEEDSARLARLNDIQRELLKRFAGRTKKMPRLKICRVLATFFPRDFTTISHRVRLGELHDRMFDEGGSLVDQHVRIQRRLDRLLGPCGDRLEDQVARMTVPWLLYELESAGEEQPSLEVTGGNGEFRLVPLPAVRRRRGLSMVKGFFLTVQNVLQTVEQGITREDLQDALRVQFPDHKEQTRRTTISVLINELGVIRQEGNLLGLTPIGRAILETGEPDALLERLVTRVLGFDHGLVFLRDHGPSTGVELQREIQKANPGWTGLLTPSHMRDWFKSLGLVEKSDAGGLQLTESGRMWAEQIHWKPECLPAEDAPEPEPEPPLPAPGGKGGPLLPDFEALYERISSMGDFPRPLVAELHACLWAHPRRHFAILTGLSGSGKTLLARAYGSGLMGSEEEQKQRFLKVPVQPGWYDPGPILGYVNPLRPDTYVRTPFLELASRALADPEHPHVVLLDEMNLSRPEQYLAPLLSAMETGVPIDLHAEEEGFDGVPRKLHYPSNLVILGTVNMDETTHALSDKVLDRAFTFEFWDVDVAGAKAWVETKLPTAQRDEARAVLVELGKALAPARLHFGRRVIDEVLRFLERCLEHGILEDPQALDAAVFAKVLPKIRGDDSERFRRALGSALETAKNHQLPRCQEKLRSLIEDVETTGSARFWR